MENRWQINLKIWEFVFLAACIVAALFCAYFFGYRAGHAVGYDEAKKIGINKTARYEVFEDAPQNLDDESLNQIYAKLADDNEIESEDNQDAAPNLETLNTIKLSKNTLEDSHLNPDSIRREREQQEIAKKKSEDLRQEGIDKAKELEQERLKEKKALEAKLKKEEEAREEKQAPTPTPELKVEEETKEIIQTNPVPRGWYVQVATSRNHDAAKKLVNNLKNSGFPAEIEVKNVSGQSFFRIMVGPESSKSYAERLKDQLGRERYLSGKPFIKQIN